MRFLIHLFEIVTEKKSFVDNPVLGSKTLNRLGLHVLRIGLAHGITRLRWAMLVWRLPKAYRKQFHKNGYILIENFLDEKEFEEIVAAVAQLDDNLRECHQGDTITQRAIFDDAIYSETPALNVLKCNSLIKNLFRYAGSANHSPLIYKENIVNGGILGQDPQKDLHTDTFHPTVKAWLYLEDVTPDIGPYHYVEGSHRLSWARLRWEYKKSINASQSGNHYTGKGSFRISEAELEELGLPQAKTFTVKKNTFVLANTFGFHRRGQADAGTTRLSVYMQDRVNPFWPFPSFDCELFRRWRIAYLKQRDRKEEEQALGEGRQPVWASVKPD